MSSCFEQCESGVGLPSDSHVHKAAILARKGDYMLLREVLLTFKKQISTMPLPD
jgi:hypothetical protein